MRQALRRATRQGWYQNAYNNLFGNEGTPKATGAAYQKYISLDCHRNEALFQQLAKGKRSYSDFVDEAVQLAVVYIEAARQVQITPRVNDNLRKAFLAVVVDADLGFPLELGILKEAEGNLPRLQKCVEEIAAETTVAPS